MLSLLGVGLFAAPGPAPSMAAKGRAADLKLTSRAAPVEAELGKVATLTITVTNHGPAPASNVVVTLARGRIYEFAGRITLRTSRGRCRKAPRVVGLCRLGTLRAHTSVRIRIVARASEPSTLDVAATGYSQTPDRNYFDNRTDVFADFASSTPADLSVALSASPNPAHVGSFLEYTLTVSNAGPGSSYFVFVLVPIPSGATLVAADGGEAGQCGRDALFPRTVQCVGFELDPGQSGKATIVVRPQAAGQLTLTAYLALLGDSNPANNFAEVTTTVAA